MGVIGVPYWAIKCLCDAYAPVGRRIMSTMRWIRFAFQRVLGEHGVCLALNYDERCVDDLHSDIHNKTLYAND